MADSKGSNYTKVGIFVTLGLVVACALIFIIGDERHMFHRKVVLHTQFHDVSGLRAGSPVRMGGVNVGQVTAVRFSNDPHDADLHVDFEIVDDALVRVRRNSIAQIASKGLLGDKALDITIGDPAQAQVQNGETIRGESNDEIGNAMRYATTLLDRANTVMDNIVTATRPFRSEQLGNDVIAMAHDLRSIANQVATGQGTVGRLLRDEQMANQIQGTLASAQQTMREVQGTAAQVEAMARDARNGHGLVHALIYDEAGGRAVQSMGTAADEFAAITHDIRSGNGGLHNIIYGTDSSEAVANINQATASLRDIMHDVQRGRGTIGALLVDPSLYEDLKSLVGNVQRNEILRAMVRYSIHANERAGQPTVTASGGSESSGAPSGGGSTDSSVTGTSSSSAP
jgi:phospholipid/cholesterol/gamma-HCH transport system substrate-binding protein